MQNQEIFTTVVTHLRTQNEKSLRGMPETAYVGCAYRGEAGRQCAVGCLIKDEFYSVALEGRVLFATYTQLIAALEKSGVKFEEDTINLLRALQRTHDGYDPEYWEREFAKISKQHDLVLP